MSKRSLHGDPSGHSMATPPPLSIHSSRITSPQDMMAEAMRVGLSEAKKLFAEPKGAAAELDESGIPSKAERGKAEGGVLWLVRSALASRCVCITWCDG